MAPEDEATVPADPCPVVGSCPDTGALGAKVSHNNGARHSKLLTAVVVKSVVAVSETPVGLAVDADSMGVEVEAHGSVCLAVAWWKKRKLVLGPSLFECRGGGPSDIAPWNVADLLATWPRLAIRPFLGLAIYALTGLEVGHCKEPHAVCER